VVGGLAASAIALLMLGACDSSERERPDGDDGIDAGEGGVGGRDAGHAGQMAGDPTRCVDGGEIPSELPSRQTVTLIVRNDSAADRYLSLGGSWCHAYLVTARDGAEPVRAGGSCPGQQRGDGVIARAAMVGSLRPGAWNLSWDAREMALCESARADCPHLTTTKGALQPAAPGGYVASVVAYGTLPTWCTEAPSELGLYACDGNAPATTFTPRGLCDRSAELENFAASADFTLPESGDLEVVLVLK
jgi:hypothetical protein